jgi:hypothetical protein
MPKKPNYNFEKQQKERAREQKRNAKAEEKRLRKESERADKDRGGESDGQADGADLDA